MSAALARALKDKARALGAQQAGIAPADPLDDAGFLEAWLAAGRHATMGYMEKPERRDIRRWYPEARSVLVCAFSYWHADPPERAEPGASSQGRVARYATLPDYHPILKARLGSLLEWLKKESPGADGKPFVDSSPVLERAYARRAGIGWTGKNTLTLHPRLGSFFFLAGLALNLDLPADEPVPDHCGTCRRCLDACPTDAFPKPHELDASRCIAYFTIEHRGAIPEGFRKGVGDWAFGCDVCQDVCPWNRFSAPSTVAEFMPEGEPAFPTRGPLKNWLRMRPEDFKALKRTPLERARWRGWIRNVLLAAGNSGDPSLAPAVEPWTKSEDAVIREQAEWSLARLKSSA